MKKYLIQKLDAFLNALENINLKKKGFNKISRIYNYIETSEAAHNLIDFYKSRE